MNQPSPSPGWYPDPDGGPALRWFNGTDWTYQYQAPTQQFAPPNWTEHRAQPQSKKSKKGIILGSIGAVLALFLLIGLASGGEDEKKSPTTTKASAPSSSVSTVAPVPVAPEPVGPTVAPAGSAVRDGKFEFRVLSIERAKSVSDPTGNPYMTTTAQGEFIVITMSVTNIGNEAQNYFGQNQKVIDANGREYDANSAAGMWMNTGLSIMGDINPGNAIQVKIAFDVPPGTQATELELHDSMFSGGVSVRLV